MTSSSQNHAVILYDGECGLCDRLVQFVLPRDRVGRFKFAALQSPWAQRALREHGLATTDFDTMVLLEDNRVYLRSTAALRVLSRLPRWWWTRPLLVLPGAWRDFVYGLVARGRKRWFPAPIQCAIKRREWAPRFLE